MARTPRLDDFLPYQLSLVTNAVSARIAESYRDTFGLKVTEWRVMAVLGDGGARTQRDIARATMMDKVAVNRACKAMAARGLLARAPNPADGRSHHLALTAEGAAIHARIMPHAQAIERRLFAVLTAEEQTSLRDLLARVREQADALGPDADYGGIGD
ncbi:MAG: MarR family transcriptional regulator [Pelagerythrobacter marensis]|nr:MAG: MarR family transcriptional regulator [Pelagerythrobacter marensis]